MEEELGIWNFIHGTGAGCASIAAWEAAHAAFPPVVAAVTFGTITVAIMHVVHRHRLHLSKRSSK